MRRTHLAASAAILAMLSAAPAAVAKPKDVNSSRLERMVTVQAVRKHQQALQNIADLNGGTRYTRTAGYTASAAYVKSTLEKAGYNVSYSMFNMPEWVETDDPVLQQTAPDSKTYTPGHADDDGSTAVDFIAFEHSPTKALSNVEVVPVGSTKIPSTGGSTSGCAESDYTAANSGTIALIQRGTCAFTQKLQLAEKAGAVGVILFNEGDSPGREPALFRSADPGYSIPAVLSSYQVGEELYKLAQEQKHPKVNLSTSGVDQERLYPNVVAESKRGDAKHMVLAGAHLDSVPAGPGINDDGSGTSYQLALAEQIAKQGTPPRNKIRFLFFGGEEDGLVGSQYYAAHMSDADVANSDVMIDTDMIASPNFARLVYDGDGSTFGEDVSGPAGSGEIEQVFVDYWNKRGMKNEPIPFDGRSDYVGFVNRGIPSGGVFAGAEAPKTAEQVKWYGGVEGEQLDPCYHEDCDTFATQTGQPPAETMNVYEADPTPANLVIAQQQADELNGGATRSLEQFKGNLTHAIWYFARSKAAGPDHGPGHGHGHGHGSKGKQAKTHHIKARGHKHAHMR
jgi:Zn-dependent M28 family amino/carboxypeptidase